MPDTVRHDAAADRAPRHMNLMWAEATVEFSFFVVSQKTKTRLVTEWLYFNDIPHSIDIYKGIFLYVISARIIVLLLNKLRTYMG